MELYIVRHGQTEWNKERRLQGSTDIMLTKEGIEAAKKTGTALRKVAFDKIYSSPLTRAYDTACYIRADRNIEIVKDERLRELCFGNLEGQVIEDMQNDKESHFKYFFDKPHLYIPDDKGETLYNLKERTRNFLVNEIEANEKNLTRVMIVAHGALNKALVAHIKKNSIEEFWMGGVQKNCSAFVVKLEDNIYEIIDEEKRFY